MIFEDIIEKYKGYDIKQDKTIKRFKCYVVINHNVLYGGSVEVLKRKIDRYLKKEVLK